MYVPTKAIHDFHVPCPKQWDMDGKVTPFLSQQFKSDCFGCVQLDRLVQVQGSLENFKIITARWLLVQAPIQ
jgi:hypothetical protein